MSLTVNLEFDANAQAAPASFRTAIQTAANMLDAAISNNITVNIKVGYGEDNGDPVINGSAEGGPDNGLFESYSTVRADLIADAAPADTNFNALPLGSSIQGQTQVVVWNAQLKAMGLLSANDTTTDDGSCGFATDISSSLLVGVALHELAHAMGRVNYGPQPDIFDLFRFTGPGVRLFTSGATAPAAYFSVDGGNTPLADYGETSDASDFLNPPNSNLSPDDPFNEFYDSSTIQQLTSVDLTQLDVLGFNTFRNVVPAATTAIMVMSDLAGNYTIFDIGQNRILASNALTQINPAWHVAGLGGFNGTDTTDMLMRNSNTGALELYDVSKNNVTAIVAMGQVGLEWSVAGFGDFSGNANETDMLMRNTSSGAFELYDISNNQYTGYYSMGQVGLEWSVAGFGDFSGNPNETDMLMRNSSGGQFKLYDINNNQYTGFYSTGQVGLEWSVAGFGNFSGNANETDMLMRDNSTGAFELFDIHNNQFTGPSSMGQVGLEWSVAGFGDFSGNANETDMLMRNNNTGAFELFDIYNNQYTGFYSLGQVGAGLSVNDITNSTVNSTALLVQAMAAASPSDASSSGGDGQRVGWHDQLAALPGAPPQVSPANQLIGPSHST
jgi:hypothetical protein